MFSVPASSDIAANMFAFSGGPYGQWGDNDGQFRALIFFMNGTDGEGIFFNDTDIQVACQPTVDPCKLYSM